MTAWVWILIKMLPHLNWLFSSNISNFRENPFSGSALKLVFFKASQHFSLYENGHFCIFYLFSSTLHSSFDGKHFIVDKKKYIFEFTKQPTLNIAYSLPRTCKWPFFWPQTRPKQTFWSLIVNNTNQGQILPPKICPTNCQPIFFLTQCNPNNRHPNHWLNNFLPNKLQPNDNSIIKLQIPNKGDKYRWI